MNLKLLSLTAVLMSALAGGVQAQCVYPDKPGKIPSGKTATAEEMLAAQTALKDFDLAVNEYVDCLQVQSDAEIAKLAQQESDPKKLERMKNKVIREISKKQDAAINEDKAMAARYNREVKRFNAQKDK